MNAIAILFELAHSGFNVTLDGSNLRIVPASQLTSEQRSIIVANKPSLVALLADAHRTAKALLQAIEATCDARGDDDTNRAALLRECAQMKPHEQADALEHFRGEAQLWQAFTGRSNQQTWSKS